MTNRPLFTWIILAVCLLAATSAVGWLTWVAWRADQTRQEALLDSEVRNALWRLDSLAAPLVAIEGNRPSLNQPFTGTPVLAPRLVRGYVMRDALGHWSIRRDPHAATCEPLPDDSEFPKANWQTLLHETVVGEPASQAGIATATAEANDDLIIWPAPPPAATANPTRTARGQMARMNSPGQQSAIDRNQLMQNVQQMTQQPVAGPSLKPLEPIWVAGELVLAREIPGESAGKAASPVEFCWLNWPEWNSLLTAQLEGVSVPLRLQPCDNRVASFAGTADEWRMVSLPVRLERVPQSTAATWPLPLIGVWVLLVAVALAFVWLQRQTLALSERRAAFVSAVTHELRTPLTTFRLYTEMLSSGVVSDPEQQHTYFETLHREANRLTRLVENVLAYARLERGRPTACNETVTVGELIERCRPRLEQRTTETPLSLVVTFADTAAAVCVTTNVLAVEQILFNLIDNSCKYARDAADPRILCDVALDGRHVIVRVADFGPGLSAAARAALFQPFRKSASQAAESAPGIGLGLSLSMRLAEELRGSLSCKPNSPTGLCFEFRLPLGEHGKNELIP
jgi:signal transduction histidine kinase